jgi:hypothetical protein
MLEGGLRPSHAIYIVENYKAMEIVEINGLGVDTPRLVCFHDKDFCRYHVGVRETAKPCEWAYFSTETLRFLEKYAGSTVNRRSLELYVKRRATFTQVHEESGLEANDKGNT